jgi:uncharacterized iron-regulated membrane protein
MSYFDYEKISEHLPGDEEAIIVYRKDGELNVRECPFLPDDLVSDQHSMGRLLIANQRIHNSSGLLWVLAVVLILLSSGLLVTSGKGWSYWWLHLNVFVVVLAAQNWFAGARQRQTFRAHVLGALQEVRAKQGLSDPAFLALLKQMSDFQSLASCYQAHLAVHYKDPAIKQAGD